MSRVLQTVTSGARSMAALASGVALTLAVAPGIYSKVRYGQWGTYDLNAAVLTATLIAVIWYTAFTFEGLAEWREEMRTRVTFSAARNLKIASERVSRAFDFFRTPVIRSREDRHRPGGLVDPDSQLMAAIERGYQHRTDGLKEALETLDEAVVEASAVWRESGILRDRHRLVRADIQTLDQDLNFHLECLRNEGFRTSLGGGGAWEQAQANLWGADVGGEVDQVGERFMSNLEALKRAADSRMDL